MLTVRSILCPVDFSEQSRQALLWASVIAQHRGSALTVLSVVEPLLAQAAGIRLGVDLTRTEAEPALREFVDATLPEGVRQASHVRTEVTVGDTSEAILQTARRLKAGLIVMGTHGIGGFRKLLLGSTTEQVPLVLAHVVAPAIVPPRWQALVADFENDRMASGQRMLARLSASFTDVHSDCVVSVGRPADTIASLAAEYESGLVVLGLANAEDSDLRQPGSIAYRVLRTAHVAVVVVPHPEAPAAPDPAGPQTGRGRAT